MQVETACRRKQPEPSEESLGRIVFDMTFNNAPCDSSVVRVDNHRSVPPGGSVVEEFHSVNHRMQLFEGDVFPLVALREGVCDPRRANVPACADRAAGISPNMDVW